LLVLISVVLIVLKRNKILTLNPEDFDLKNGVF